MSLFRLSVMVAGVVFAMGFLCVPLVGPPSTNGWWVTALCVGSCLLVSLSCVPSRAGRVALWALALCVALLVGWAFFTKLTEPDPRPWAARWDWSLGFLRAVGLFTIYVIGSYLRARRDRPLNPSGDGYPLDDDMDSEAQPTDLDARTIAWGLENDLELEDEAQGARETGLVYCRFRRVDGKESPQAILVSLVPGLGVGLGNPISLLEAQRHGTTLLAHSAADAKTAMPEEEARRFVGRFLDEIVSDGPTVQAWRFEGDAKGALVLRGENVGGALVVDDNDHRL